MSVKTTERKWLAVFRLSQPSPEEVLIDMAADRERTSLAEEAQAALHKLPQQVRQAVVMSLDNHPVKEIAKATGLKARVVPRLIRDAMDNIRLAVA